MCLAPEHLHVVQVLPAAHVTCFASCSTAAEPEHVQGLGSSRSASRGGSASGIGAGAKRGVDPSGGPRLARVGG